MTAPEVTRISIISPDGDVFPVAGPDQWERGVCLADEDTGTDYDGMYDAPFEAIYNATAFQIGADFGGVREDKYEFVLAFHIKGTRTRTLRQADSEFRRAFDARRQSKIVVHHEDSTRWLDVRLGGKPRIKSKNDPNGEQYLLILYPIIAGYPRWREDDFPSSFVTTTDTTGGGTETGYVTISNPCDVDIWLKWVLQGTPGIIWTVPDYSWGNDQFGRAVEDSLHKIVMPPLIDGEHVTIDTDPDSNVGQVNSDLDTEIYLRMNGKTFMYKIPPGTTATLPITVSHAPIGAVIQAKSPRTWTRPLGLEA